MNECGSVLISLHLQKQAVGRIWSMAVVCWPKGILHSPRFWSLFFLYILEGYLGDKVNMLMCMQACIHLSHHIFIQQYSCVPSICQHLCLRLVQCFFTCVSRHCVWLLGRQYSPAVSLEGCGNQCMPPQRFEEESFFWRWVLYTKQILYKRF